MPIDLGSPIVEVAIGLAFIYFLFSIVISSAVEGIAQVLQIREKELETGVTRILGDESLATTVIDHPLFKSDVTNERGMTGRRKRRPAYVSSRNFSLALCRVLRRRGADSLGAEAAEGLAPAVVVKAGIVSSDERAREQLESLFEVADEELPKFRRSVEHWYDDAMDRVSGWYRNWSQFVTCFLALIIALGLNVDTIRIGERIANDATLRSAVVEQARANAEAQPSSAGQKSPAEAGETAATALSSVSGLHLPILWGNGNGHFDGKAIAGWLITFLALSLGAPFWFDALNRLARLRSSGKKPERADAEGST